MQTPSENLTYGILGKKLGHSYSPLIHARWGAPYLLQEVAPSQLEAWVKARHLAGYNVTMPYKKSVIPLLDGVDPQALELGAVNTVVDCGGKLLGYNTDAPGLALALQRAGLTLRGHRVLVLGSGGAGTMAAALARQAGAAEVLMVSRQGPVHYGNVYELVKAPALLINATPCGMYPHAGEAALSLRDFKPGLITGVFDLVYNPLCTALVLEAKALGIPARGGLGMLTAQAVLARHLFDQAAAGSPLPQLPAAGGFAPDLEARVCATTQALAREVSNLVLIGMPGCGKTTLGKALARETGKSFVDTDALLTQETGLPAGEYMARVGEEAFRDLESRIIARVGAQKNQVIACGGGVVTRAENYASLKQNGFICFLQTPLDRLSRRDRPLSASPQAVAALWEARKDSYIRFADVQLVNDLDPGNRLQQLHLLCNRIEALYRHFCQSFI